MSSKLTLEDFINRCHKTHNHKYDYSQIEYINISTKINILCTIHKNFLQTPRDHLYGQAGCPKCKTDKSRERATSNEEFIKICKSIHGDRYDYSLVNYKNCRTKVIIICKEHGSFSQFPNFHIKNKSNCPRCANLIIKKKLSYTANEFKELAYKIHGDKYNYDQVEYSTNKDKLKILCKTHGYFFQTGHAHLRAQGCNKCSINISHKERDWIQSLNIISLITQHPIKINNKKYLVDGFDPITNTVYEFNGDFWHGNPKVYDLNTINHVTKTSFGELYQKTIQKANDITSAGYNLISVWESDL